MEDIKKVFEKDPPTVLVFGRYNKGKTEIERMAVVTTASMVRKVRGQYRRKGWDLEKWNKKEVSGLDDLEKEARELRSRIRGLKESKTMAKKMGSMYGKPWHDCQDRLIRESEKKLEPVLKEIKELTPAPIGG